MKKEITLGQLLSVAAMIIVSVMTAWYSMSKRVTEIETKQSDDRTNQYNSQLATDKKIDNLNMKIDNINNNTTQILVNLERKQDRK